MTSNKKLKKSLGVVPKKAQFNITAREDHVDYQLMLEAKELFAQLIKDAKISRTALLLKLVKSFSLAANFTNSEKQLVAAAAEHEEISFEEFNRRSAMLYATKIVSKKTTLNGHNGYGDESFVVKPKSIADLKVNQIVAEIMLHNDNASSWQDKREITNRSVNDWGKHTATKVAYKSISTQVLRRYFMLHRDQINQHHYKHDIKPDHNRRAVAAHNKQLRKANLQQARSSNK